MSSSSSLNVIALISGGKDSFFSILHCLQNGHKVIALGNLYPPVAAPPSTVEDGEVHGNTTDTEEHDLNSFMYQTVGHTIIPLYEKALGIPLYRQDILGTAVQTGTTYSHCEGAISAEQDETESLIPLLNTILVHHPTANALCTGAILSTYQRTRIESVALRLGLVPVAYLWKYPILPPCTQTSLLEDMHSVGFDARIVKVASGGLDESFLWLNVASEVVLKRVEKAMRRFGEDGDGAIIGEGGEFETVLLNGPWSLFKGRIVVPAEGRRVVREGGGAAWLHLAGAEVVMKDSPKMVQRQCRIPDLLETRFKDVLQMLCKDGEAIDKTQAPTRGSAPLKIPRSRSTGGDVLLWTVSTNKLPAGHSISTEASHLIEQIQSRLFQSSRESRDIISTIIILRSMQDFTTINQIYSTLFPHANPPSRITISCGDTLPANTNIVIHLRIHQFPLTQQPPPRKALHVQSRSYWAPANIGPYSQAIAIPAGDPDDAEDQCQIWTVSVAGQIPLIPQSMVLPSAKEARNEGIADDDALGEFKLQTVLSLQHLWRIGQDMDVAYWTGAVAYLPRVARESTKTRAVVAGRAWKYLHREMISEDEDDESRDLWEEKHFAGRESHWRNKTEKALPYWEVVEHEDKGMDLTSPFFAVEVEELPRGSGIEWHALLGISNGPVKLRNRLSPGRWNLNVCGFADVVHILVVVDYVENAGEVQERLHEALISAAVDLSTAWRSHLSYIDMSVEGILGEGVYGGIIPCRSIWSGAGERLCAVLLFEGKRSSR